MPGIGRHPLFTPFSFSGNKLAYQGFLQVNNQ